MTMPGRDCSFWAPLERERQRTLLLNLAHELLIRVQGDSHHPIAVILNLSSWAARKPPLEAWVIDQLRLVYGGVPLADGHFPTLRL